MGCIGPSDVVEVGVPLRIGLGGVDETTAIVIVDGHLLGKQEPGTQPRRLSPKRQYGRHSPSVPDAAGRNHGNRCHRIHDGGDQRECCDLAPHMSSRLPPLGHDDVDAAVDRPPGLLGAADRVQNDPVGVVDLFDVARWDLPPRSDTTRRPASRASSSRRCWSEVRIRLPPNGRSVSAAV